MEKNFINRWDSDAFETKEIAKKIADDLKKSLKFCHILLMAGDQNLTKT